MRSTKIFVSDRLFFAAMVVLLMGWSISPTPLQAQSQGNNAVYSNSSTVTGSTAFIDASVFSLINGTIHYTDICARINAALVSLPSGTFGAVIDARGIGGSDLTSCPTGSTPWQYVNGTFQSSSTNPATILLPSGTITTTHSWGLPNTTRLIGLGAGGPGAGVTTLQAASGSSFTWMLQMGGSTLCSTPCVGISVEDLALDGNGYVSSGILNGQSQELSYVKHVRLYNLSGVGLEVQNNAQNSGPYSDISFSTANAVSGTECAWIDQVSTRGIHGLTCTGNTGTGTIPNTGVLLDGDNNSIEDVQVQGFQDGIRIGENASAQSNVLLNIAGGTNVTNVVHIYVPPSGDTVSDLSIMGVGNGGVSSVHTIQDDLTGTTLSDTTVGMYVLGEPVLVGTTSSSIGYSRFTTSPNAPNWGVGGTAPITGTGATCTTGSLFTNTSGTTAANTLFVCANGLWQPE
jgi:hypothetical protein